MSKQLLFSFIILTISNQLFAQKVEDNEACRALYDEEKFEAAYDCYKTDDQQLFSVYMSAYLAKFLERKKEFKKHYKTLLSDQFNTPDQYYYAAYLHPTNSKKFLKTLNKGLKTYPADTVLMLEQVNYYIEIKDYDAGLPILDKLIELKKDDLLIYITAGNIYNWQEKYQKAIPYFQKAFELDNENIDANYGLGLIYFNQGADLILQANTVAGAEEQKRLESEAHSLLKKAMPYLETAYKIESDNKDLKSALLTCYKNLGMQVEYELLLGE